MWMECQLAALHFNAMKTETTKAAEECLKALGKQAHGRESIDFLCEAARLKFSLAEIEELRRLYGLPPCEEMVKAKQKL
jgi:hypothetical protein